MKTQSEASPPQRRRYAERVMSRVGRTVLAGARSLAVVGKAALHRPVRILTVVAWRLGDEVMVTPLYQAIKTKFPHSRLTVQTNFPELLEGNPYVDAVNSTDSWFDVAYDLREDVQGELRYVGLARKHGLPLPQQPPRLYLSDRERAERTVCGVTFEGSHFVAVSTGAHWCSRRWSVERFREVCALLARREGVRIVELGRDCPSMSVGVNLVNQTTVREAAVILSKCGLFIGSDSGLMHLALAVGTPTVGLFGPVSPADRVAPQSHFAAVWSNVACRGCWSEKRMLEADCCPLGAPICMDAVTADEVLEAAARWLPAPRRNCARRINNPPSA